MRSTQVRELRLCSSFRIFFFPYFAWNLCPKNSFIIYYYFNYFYNITFVITFFKMFPKCHLFCVIYGKKRSRWLSKIQSKNCEEFLESQPSSSLSYVTFTLVGDSPFLRPVSRQWPCWQGETSRYVLEQNDQQQRTGRKRQKDPEASYVCVWNKDVNLLRNPGPQPWKRCWFLWKKLLIDAPNNDDTPSAVPPHQELW